jgi:hypothetical protein
MVEDQTRTVEREQLTIAATMPTAAPGTALGEIAIQLANHCKGSTAFMRSLQALAWDLQRKGLKLKGYSMEPLVPAGTLTELSKLRLQHCIHRSSSSSVSPLVDVQYHVALP